MEKRFYYDEFLEEIYDSSIDDYPSNITICGILNDQQQRIAELEEQLANSIRPKFKIGQEVFVLDWTGQLRSGEICEIQTNQVRLIPLITYLVDFYGSYCDDDLENDYFEEKDVFATKEEAQAKLKELQGE